MWSKDLLRKIAFPPHALSRPRSLWGKTPGQGARGSPGQAIITGLGSVCNHAIRQDMRNYEDNVVAMADNSVAARHFALQREPMATTPADYVIGPSSDEMQPIHVMDACQERIQRLGPPQ